HPDYATSLNNLACVCDDQGNFAKAEPLYVEALAIRKQALGEKHPDYAPSLNNLAHRYAAQRNAANADRHGREGVAIVRRHLELTATIQSEREQLLMADERRFFLDGFLSASRAGKVAPDRVYDELLAWKGAVTGRQTFVRALRRDLANQAEA